MTRDSDNSGRKRPRGRPFAKGQSGNPGGRPKKDKTFFELLEKDLSKTRKLRKDGREIRTTKAELGASGLATAIAKNEPWAIRLLAQLNAKSMAAPPPPSQEDLYSLDPDSPLRPSEEAAIHLTTLYTCFSLKRSMGEERWKQIVEGRS